MRKAMLVLALSSFALGCSPGQSPPTATSAHGASPSPPVSSRAAPPGAGSAARMPVACSAEGLAAANDACLSPACAEIPADMKACEIDTDCKVETFASCECVNAAPFFSVNAQSYSAARGKFRSKYASECNCACPTPVPACVGGMCGFRYP